MGSTTFLPGAMRCRLFLAVAASLLHLLAGECRIANGFVTRAYFGYARSYIGLPLDDVHELQLLDFWNPQEIVLTSQLDGTASGVDLSSRGSSASKLNLQVGGSIFTLQGEASLQSALPPSSTDFATGTWGGNYNTSLITLRNPNYDGPITAPAGKLRLHMVTETTTIAHGLGRETYNRSPPTAWSQAGCGVSFGDTHSLGDYRDTTTFNVSGEKLHFESSSGYGVEGLIEIPVEPLLGSPQTFSIYGHVGAYTFGGPVYNNSGMYLQASVSMRLAIGENLIEYERDGDGDPAFFTLVYIEGEPVPLPLSTDFSPADFNSDGLVDGRDLSWWQSGFGTQNYAQRADGDADKDRNADGADFLIWQREVSSLQPGGVVPEPASIHMGTALLVLMGLTRTRFVRSPAK